MSRFVESSVDNVVDKASRAVEDSRRGMDIPMRRITGVQFRPDLFVELTLGVSRGELFDAFVDTAKSTGAVKSRAQSMLADLG